MPVGFFPVLDHLMISLRGMLHDIVSLFLLFHYFMNTYVHTIARVEHFRLTCERNKCCQSTMYRILKKIFIYDTQRSIRIGTSFFCYLFTEENNRYVLRVVLIRHRNNPIMCWCIILFLSGRPVFSLFILTVDCATASCCCY
jgi:hypothetical protein